MNCCEKPKETKKDYNPPTTSSRSPNGERAPKGFLKGILYGLAPHTFCIAFVIFTILGATVATAFLKPLLLNRYFFYILIALSFVFATISAIFYLKRNGILSFPGIKKKWRYFSILYGATILVNLLFFMVIFPIVANLNFNPTRQSAALIEKTLLSSLTLKVDIPCPGHAPLITTELKKINGVKDVKFSFPNLFDVKYNSLKTSKEEILSLDVFQTYSATVVSEATGNAEESLGNAGSCSSCGGGGCGCGCGR